MARSLNKVQLIGNLTRDPELRYTPNGNAVCSFGIATNRSWTTEAGEKREEVDFHNIIAWNKLGELCSQFLVKGRKVYVEGRLSTRSWTGQDGQQKTRTEVVIDDMILLDSKGNFQKTAPSSDDAGGSKEPEVAKEPETEESSSAKASEDEEVKPAKKATRSTSSGREKEEVKEESRSAAQEEEVMPDDIPF